MKKTNTVIIILLAIIILLLIALGAILFFRGNEDTWICEGGAWVKHGKPSQPMPQTPCGAPSGERANQPEAVLAENEQPELIGGQRDEHGCLIGAGYSWCEAKQKCLRAWEEKCPEEEKGIIEGSLSYPSEFIPEMKICAESSKSGETICTTDQIKNNKYAYGVGYRLEVPAGAYQVYAMLLNSKNIGADAFENYRAYYSDFVLCGLSYGCPSHAPISVTVKAGEAVSKIDPIDWYKN